MFSILQGAGLGDPGVLVVSLLVLVFATLLAYWVYNDAKGRGNDNAALWALGIGILTLVTLFGGLIAFGVYLWVRS